MTSVPYLYQVVTSMGVVVFESISESACQLFIEKSENPDQLTCWPIYFKEMTFE